MTMLALMRHADTAWSVAGRIQGRTDVPILPRTSIALPQRCRGMRVIASPLGRCVQTAALLGLSYETDPRLMEMHWGAWEGQTLAQLREHPGMKENEARGLDFRPEGGESPRDVLARVQTWLREVANDGRATLAVTHRGVIRVVFAQASGWDLRGPPPHQLQWDAVHFFRLDAEGRPAIDSLNVR
jgi:broad specificity phosphatase PhoE